MGMVIVAFLSAGMQNKHTHCWFGGQTFKKSLNEMAPANAVSQKVIGDIIHMVFDGQIEVTFSQMKETTRLVLFHINFLSRRSFYGA